MQVCREGDLLTVSFLHKDKAINFPMHNLLQRFLYTAEKCTSSLYGGKY